MRQTPLYSLAVLLASGFFSTAVAAPHTKRVAQSLDELVVIPIDDSVATDPVATTLDPNAPAATGFFKVKRAPQIDGSGSDELVVIPIDDAVDSPAPVAPSNPVGF